RAARRAGVGRPVGLEAGFCARQPSLYDRRRRRPPAVHPGTRAGALERSLSDLAPGGVCRAGLVTEAAVVSYTTLSPLPPRPEGCGGGLLSVALSRGSLRVGVTHHRAGWSPDFPRPRGRGPEDAAARPTGPRPVYDGPAPPLHPGAPRAATCARSPRPSPARRDGPSRMDGC